MARNVKHTGKLGPRNVQPSMKGSNPVHNSPGNPGKVMPQAAIPGPTNPGQPPAMKKALAKKARGGTTGFAGSAR
jgi:hypothetical protein